jgi:putative serine protease PepD
MNDEHTPSEAPAPGTPQPFEQPPLEPVAAASAPAGPPAYDQPQTVRIPGYERTAETPAAVAGQPGTTMDPAAAPVLPGEPLPPAPPAEQPYAPEPVQAEPASRTGHSTGAVVGAGIVGGLFGALVVAGLFFALIVSGIGIPRSVRVTPGAAATTASAAVKISPSSLVEPAVAVARQVLPSVVNVTVYQAGHFGGDSQAAGNGSGVAYKAAPDGGTYVITNNHVVEGAEKITVKVGAKELPATVVGADPKTDIAVIKVAQDLAPIDVGDSSKLEVGQTVVAVGSPFGLDKTVTVGIVSALGRSELGDSTQGQGQGASPEITAYTNLIQTDAAINPGNSGGALVDQQGRLVGINTLIAAPAAAQSAGIGFAIPQATVTSVADQIIKGGKVEHPFLGVRSGSLTPDTVAQMGQGAPKSGAMVVDVVAGSPAAKAGLARNDVITSIAGAPVTSAETLILAIRGQEVGKSVSVEYWRGGKTETKQVTIGSDQGPTQ